MKPAATQLLFAALLTACEPVGQTEPTASNALASTRPGNASEQDYGLCGGTTQRGRIDDYFGQVAAFLQAPHDRDLLRHLVDERVHIVRDGHARTISAADFVRARPYLIPVEDWEEISRRGEEGLTSAGWRGCFYSRGKASFAVDMGGRLRLIAFNRDMPWELR